MRVFCCITAILTLTALGQARPLLAQQVPESGAVADTTPGAAPEAAPPDATKAGHVVGPDGEQLFPFSDPPKSATLQFKQIAANVTKVQVVGSDAKFELSRLPATFMTTVGREICTATLIGPKVLLTAAHCVDAKEQEAGAWRALVGEVSYADGTPGPLIHSCAMAPAYTAVDPRMNTVRNGKDYALCELVGDVKIPAETIALETNRTAIGERLLFAGYGCTEKDLIGGVIAPGNPTSGTLNVGMNSVNSIRPSGYARLLGKIGTQDAISCPGDSGGAGYANARIVKEGEDRGWRVVAVISSGGPAGPAKAYFSNLSPLSDPAFTSFVDLWRSRRPADREICGRSTVDLGSACRP